MPEERSLAGDVESTDPTPAPAPATNPLGAPNPPSTAAHVEPPTVSIVDTILDLDELLSADVRRAEKTARFCTKPWLEAEIDELEYEIDRLTDEQGVALPGHEERVQELAVASRAKQAEMGAAFRSVRMGQLPSDDWQEFRSTWREVINKGAPYPNEFYDALIGASALRPAITAQQSAQLRTRLGDPQMDELAAKAWAVNTESGVSIPKSPLSSLVLKRAARAQS